MNLIGHYLPCIRGEPSFRAVSPHELWRCIGEDGRFPDHEAKWISGMSIHSSSLAAFENLSDSSIGYFHQHKECRKLSRSGNKPESAVAWLSQGVIVPCYSLSGGFVPAIFPRLNGNCLLGGLGFAPKIVHFHQSPCSIFPQTGRSDSRRRKMRRNVLFPVLRSLQPIGDLRNAPTHQTLMAPWASSRDVA